MGVSKDHYYRLASNLAKERIQAATALIKELSAADSEQEYRYALKRLISGLASGHDSARIGFSMCLTELLSLLFDADNGTKAKIAYTSEQYLADLESHLTKQVKDKQKGKNLRAYLFGKIFGIQSLINSAVLHKELAAGNSHLITHIVDELFAIALSKSWIREIALVTMVKLITQLRLATDETIMPHILKSLSDNDLLVSMDGLLIYLTIPQTHRDSLSALAELKPSQSWKNNDPLTRGNLPLLKAAFHDRNVSPDSEEDESSKDENDEGRAKKKGGKGGPASGQNQKGSWNPQLHNVWVPLLSELIENELQLQDPLSGEPSPKKRKSNKHKSKSSESNKISLSTFWPTFDDTFFAHSASPERKHTGLQILDLCFNLPTFRPSFFLIVFGENITRCIINHISKKDRVLHNLCAKILANAVKCCKKHPEVDSRLYLLRALERECVLFDRITKTKTVRDCISGISSNDNDLEKDVTNWIDIANWLITEAETELYESSNKAKNEKFRNEHDIKTFLLDALLTLVRGNKKLFRSVVDGESKELTLEVVSSCKMVLEYLSQMTYVNSSAKEVDETIIKTAKDRLQSILAELMECFKGQVDWSGLIVHVLRDAERDNILRAQIGESDELIQTKKNAVEIWENLGKLVKKQVTKKSSSSAERQLRVNKCLVMLFSTALLELYGGDSESFGILSDLINVYEDLNNQQESEDNNIIDTLVDLMLSYLTQQSGLKKRVGTYIWESVLHDVGEQQLERLFDVLMTRENKLGMEQLFNQAVEDFEEEGDDDDEEVEEEEEEEEEEDEHDDDDDNDDEASDENSEIDEDDKSKIEEVERSTTSALAKALNVKEDADSDQAGSGKSTEDAEGKDNENGDEDDDGDDNDDDSESDESMSDEQMMAIDSQLSAIFQQRKSVLDSLRSSSKNGNERKLEAQEARQLMALCKLRVLDLLEIYVGAYPTKKEVVSIATTGLDVMKLTVDLAVGEKTHKLIKKICKNVFTIGNSKEKEAVLETLRKVLERASEAKFNALSQGCSQVAVYLVRSVCASDEDSYESNLATITGIYQKHMVKWAVDSSDRSTASIFTDLVNWLSSKKSAKKQ